MADATYLAGYPGTVPWYITIPTNCAFSNQGACLLCQERPLRRRKDEQELVLAEKHPSSSSSSSSGHHLFFLFPFSHGRWSRPTPTSTTPLIVSIRSAYAVKPSKAAQKLGLSSPKLRLLADLACCPIIWMCDHPWLDRPLLLMLSKVSCRLADTGVILLPCPLLGRQS